MSDLDDSTFARLAGETLDALFERLEEAVGDRADVELQEGVLTVDFADAGRIVLNKHRPTREIWLASSVGGAHHFAWDGTGWISTRGGASLPDVLTADISKLAAVTLY